MEEKRRLDTLEGGGFFQSSITFDEVEKVPIARRKRPKRGSSDKNKDNPFDAKGQTSCPGCGAEIENDEFLDCLISFVIGGYDHSVNDPVRIRFIQTLRNEVGKLSLPRPSQSWELETVNRIENQVRILIEAEVRRQEAKTQGETSGNISEEQIREIEVALIKLITPKIEQKVRQQIEEEMYLDIRERVKGDIEKNMWLQFEEAWRVRNIAESE
ncbi:MAG TPA: hypothetical protein EYQ53_05925 [Candidatus Poseidoniales archaeon]|jgi:hypothetical protein|nr:MAG: hypothetical protein CXT69_05345 [Euryarchaeota archaeon]HIG03900.1 hypothetical protein [Candidatus Poseidoniales archaeon]HIK78776.1 hypothetical protein [Candidatus Poseidoniales archaeon]